MWEKYYPYIIATIISLVAIICLVCDMKIKDDIDSILNAVISFASILIGFIGALFALIFSLNENPIVKYVLCNEHYSKLMKQYFKVSINSGFIAILFTVLLFFRNTIGSFNISGFDFLGIIFGIKIIWIYCVTFFSLSSYRLIYLVLKISFVSSGIDAEKERMESRVDDEEINKMDEEIAIDDEEHS